MRGPGRTRQGSDGLSSLSAALRRPRPTARLPPAPFSSLDAPRYVVYPTRRARGAGESGRGEEGG